LLRLFGSVGKVRCGARASGEEKDSAAAVDAGHHLPLRWYYWTDAAGLMLLD